MAKNKKGRYILETSSDDSDAEVIERQQSTRFTRKPPRLGIFESERTSSEESEGSICKQ